MTPLVPKEYMDARKAQIINAACECFAEKGFHKASMQDVAKTAHLSIGAIYNYFKSKEEIITAAASQDQRQNQELFENIGKRGIEDPLLEVFKTYMLVLKSTEPKKLSLNLDLFSESSRNSEVAHQVKGSGKTILQGVMSLVSNYQQGGIFDSSLDTEALTRVFLSFYFGALVQKVIEPEIDLDKYIEACEMILNGKHTGK